MIPFLLCYQKDGVKHETPVRHYTIPRVGERVIPPGEKQCLTVLTVEHDFDTHAIWVVLN